MERGGNKESREKEEMNVIGANPGRLPGGGGSLSRILKMNATLLLGGEEAVERLVACPCKSEIPVTGWEQGTGSGKPNAIVRSCITCICLPACGD